MYEFRYADKEAGRKAHFSEASGGARTSFTKQKPIYVTSRSSFQKSAINSWLKSWLIELLYSIKDTWKRGTNCICGNFP
jgi:hypothetical protein